MAITALGANVPFPTYESVTAVVLATITLNASGDRIGFIIQVPKAGTLDWFEWRAGAVGNNPDNGMRLSFQTVDVTTGFPDTASDQFRDIPGPFSANTWQTPGLMTSDGTDIGVKRTVTQGEFIACVVDFGSFVVSDSIGISVRSLALADSLTNIGSYVADASTGTYAKSTSVTPILALKYSDGTYAYFPGVLPILATNTNAFNSGSMPDERALRFKIPVKCRAIGAWLTLDVDGTVDIILYDNASNVLASISLDPDIRGTTASTHITVFFTTSVTLEAATVYRLAIKPTSVTNVTNSEFTVNAAGLMAATEGGAELYGSSRTDAGAWTDSTTTRPIMGILIDGIDVATATSGGAYTF